jgi:hypothetical protein
MSKTTDAAIDHQNMMEGYDEYLDEIAARRWFAMQQEGFK